MGKILVEISLISARGLRTGCKIGSSLLKHQWYAVGWLNPEDKYCTTIDASRSDNPIWKTKFATLLDEPSIQDSKSVVLQVEVYCREPLFLRKRLHGSATVSLKEFLTKYKQQQEEGSSRSVVEESGSYQLRKMNSSKSQGFVDVSVRLSPEGVDLGGFTGDIGGVMLNNNSNFNTSGQDYMAGSSQFPFDPMNQAHHSSMANPPGQDYMAGSSQYPFTPMNQAYHSSMANPPMNNTNPQMQQPYYPPPMQPPVPMNSGYIPKSENVTNIPSSSSSSSGGAPGGGRGFAGPGPGVYAGMGAGAVVGGAGAGLYGGETLSGFNLPSSLPQSNVPISISPPI